MTAKKRTTDKPAVSREGKSKQNQKRPERRPLGATKKLIVPDEFREEGYDYRWLMDRPERIHMYKGAWWEQVTDEHGTPVRVPSGNGEYLTLYKVESKYLQEDRERNRKKNISLIREKAKLQRDQHSHEYVPEGHDAVLKIEN